MMTQTKELPKLVSLDRISKIPVVETGFGYASGVYLKIKRSNSLVSWSLDTVEGRLHNVVVKSYPLLELPLGVVDTIVCKTLDEVEQRVPAINYAPDQLLNMTKDLVSTRIVQPVIKRADSVKQFSVNNPRLSKYGEMAVDRLDTALDKADQYVEMYLPDSSDNAESKNEVNTGDESKAKRTMQHANRLSRKLQRRLTRRTIAEAQALRKTGHDVAQFVYFSLDLMIKDPWEFANKMRQIWAHLSEDEPENQIPPANLDQLLALVTRETARRLVHIINLSVVVCKNLPSDIAHMINAANQQAMILMDAVLKTAHLDGIRADAMGRAVLEMNKMSARLNDLYLLLRKSLEGPSTVTVIPLKPTTTQAKAINDKERNHTPKKTPKKEKKETPKQAQNGNAQSPEH